MLWWIRIRGLWKLPDGRDWLWGKLGFILMGGAMLSSVPVQFSYLVVSSSLGPHGLQLARTPCPSPTPRVYSNSCPLSWWCHPTILPSVIPFSSHLQSFPASGSSNESVLRIKWPKYWSFSFSISPSNEYSGLISFRMDWLGLLFCWAPKNWRFQTVVLEKTLESPLDSKEIKPVNPKGNQPWILIGRTEVEVQILWHLTRRADSLGKTLMLGKI